MFLRKSIEWTIRTDNILFETTKCQNFQQKANKKKRNVLVKNDMASREPRWKLWKCHLFLCFIIIDVYKWMEDSGLKYANHIKEQQRRPTAIFLIISIDTVINRIEYSCFKKATLYRKKATSQDLTYSKSVCVPQRLNNE